MSHPHDDDSMAGTGDEFTAIDLGSLGKIHIYDDGDNDAYASVSHSLYRGNGDLRSAIREHRRDEGDQATLEALASASTDATVASSGGDDGYDPTPGPFVCDDCHRTWPADYNETPDADEDTCPGCAD